MRNELENIWRQKKIFYGTFERFGLKSDRNYKPRLTVLLKNIKDEYENYLCEHIWLSDADEFASLNLNPGDKVMFSGTVKTYRKGYRGSNEERMSFKPIKWDYSITDIQCVRKVYFEEPDYDFINA